MSHLRLKIFPAVLAVAATAAVLTGCSAPSTGAESGQPVDITYWNTNTAAIGGDAVTGIISDFNASHPRVKVTAKTFDGYSKLTTALQANVAAGNPPDVTQIGYSYNVYIAENFPYVPIDDIGVDTSKYSAQTLALGQVNGKQVGMPYGLSVLQVYYNADLLSKAGIDTTTLPTTWAEWTTAAQKMKDALDLPLINFQQFAGDNFIPQAMIGGNGGAVLSCTAGKPTATFDSPQGVEAMKLMGDLTQQGLATNLTSDQAMQAFLSGQTPTIITSSAVRATVQSQAGFTLGATSFPSFGSKPLSLPAGGNDLVVFAKTPDKQQAVKEFIDYLTSDPDAVTAWVKGTGYLSPLPDGAKEFTDSNALQKIASESAQGLVPWTSFPGAAGLKASQTMYDATQSLLGGNSSAQDAMTQAADTINSSISGETCGG